MDLVQLLYELGCTLPTEERFGLRIQLQRAGVSIPANLAEGHSRRSRGAFANHVSIALGSQAELETLLELCKRLTLGDSELLARCERCAVEIGKMLYGLHNSLERSRKRGLLYSIVLVPFSVCTLAASLWYLASGLWPLTSGP